MGILVQRIRLVDFRNYQEAEFEIGDKLTIISGPNAVGKTSIIEALQLTTAAQSFRNPPWKEIIRWGTDRTFVSLAAKGEGRTLGITMEVDPLGRRAYSVNGSRVRRVADARGHLPSVVFTPDDLGAIKGPSEKRRNLIDSLGDQLSRNYEALRKEYDKVLKQRNAALKEGRDDVVEALSEKIIQTAARYTSHRVSLLKRVEPHASKAYEDMAEGELLSLTYELRGLPGVPVDADVQELERALRDGLDRHRDKERQRGTTAIGPHRDDIIFEVDGKNARAFSSQGQQRTAALAWKLAEVEAVKEVAPTGPILLLDDVMSELDERRRAALISLVDQDVQTVVTTTNPQYFSAEMVERAEILELRR